ncbi:hypothetical protein KQ296_01930 [Synechococcus sp. CS-197]|nr:hypothetical protein [Synechococcus sp. CS-197]PTT96635.1 hypothetical protein DBR45_42755 [Pseudomonas sp. HMWF031]CAK24705.1 Hypothetical protein SynWH7803_2279 [Synechococcus sp. WH 7803]
MTGCSGGELLHRFTFSPEAIEAQQTNLSLRKGERLQFWNSLDVSYQKGTKLTFKIGLKPGNSKEESTVICDALNPSLTIMSSTVERNSSITKSWKQARMNCSFGPLSETQTISITALPAASGPVQVKRLILDVKR